MGHAKTMGGMSSGGVRWTRRIATTIGSLVSSDGGAESPESGALVSHTTQSRQIRRQLIELKTAAHSPNAIARGSSFSGIDEKMQDAHEAANHKRCGTAPSGPELLRLRQMADGGASWFEQSREEARLESAFKAFLRTSPEVSATLQRCSATSEVQVVGTARRAAVPSSSSSLKTRSSGVESPRRKRGKLHAGSRRRTTKKVEPHSSPASIRYRHRCGAACGRGSTGKRKRRNFSRCMPSGLPLV